MNLKFCNLFVLVFLSIILLSEVVRGYNNYYNAEEDSVIIDAEMNVDIKPRGGRQFSFSLNPQPQLFLQEEQWSVSVPVVQREWRATLPCSTEGGKPGKCVPFEECFPLRHIIQDSEINDLNEELRTSMENSNCSSVVHAGISNYRDVCCPLPTPISNKIAEPSLKATEPFVPSEFDLGRAATCGGKGLVAHTKIINGTNTTPGELPWMVVMFGKSGKQTCGASLLTDNMVLTAAHCINSYVAKDVSKIRIHIGDYNIRVTNDGRHEVRGVKRIIKHKHFNIQSFVNDIALLRLDRPVTFNHRIQPICLPTGSRNSQLVNKKLTVAGWGRTSFAGGTSPILQKVDVKVWTNSDCAAVYKGIAPAGILSTMICAGEKGLDSCVGDSGGPLMYKTDQGYFEQIGIVSFGKGCGTHPGVYTRLTQFLQWISTNINK